MLPDLNVSGQPPPEPKAHGGLAALPCWGRGLTQIAIDAWHH